MADLVAHVDGGSHGNPGPAGIGVVIEGSRGGKIKISKGGIALLEINLSCTSGKLLWLFPPKFAKAAL